MPLVLAFLTVLVVVTLSATGYFVVKEVVKLKVLRIRTDAMDRSDLIREVQMVASESFTQAAQIASEVVEKVGRSQQETLARLVDMVHGPQVVDNGVDEHPEMDMRSYGIAFGEEDGKTYITLDPTDGTDVDDIGWPVDMRIEPADTNAQRAVSVRPGERLI